VDIIISLAWFAAFGLMIDALQDLSCDAWDVDWNRFAAGNLCDRWQAATAFAFLSAMTWLFSAILVCIRTPLFVVCRSSLRPMLTICLCNRVSGSSTALAIVLWRETLPTSQSAP
jgi:hypothetical protein